MPSRADSGPDAAVGVERLLEERARVVDAGCLGRRLAQQVEAPGAIEPFLAAQLERARGEIAGARPRGEAESDARRRLEPAGGARPERVALEPTDVPRKRRCARESGCVVPPDDLRERGPRLLGPLREPVREPHVEASPLGAREARVARVPQERVPVRVARAEQHVLLRLGDERPADERLERGSGLLNLEHRQRLARKAAARDGGAPRRGTRRRRQVVELRGVDRLHGQRQLDLFGRRGEPPAGVVGGEDPDPRPRPQQLLDEERVPGGALGDALDELGRQRLADELAHELLRLARREQRQVEPLAAVHPLRTLVEQHRPGGRHDEAPARSSASARRGRGRRAGPARPSGRPRPARPQRGRRRVASRPSSQAAKSCSRSAAGCASAEPTAPSSSATTAARASVAPAARASAASSPGALVPPASCATGSKGESTSGRRRARRTAAPAAAAASSSSSRVLPTPGGATTVTRVVEPTSAPRCVQLAFAAECRRAQPSERSLARPLGVDADGSPRRHGLGLPLQLERRQALELDRVRDGECRRPRRPSRSRARLPPAGARRCSRRRRVTGPRSALACP